MRLVGDQAAERAISTLLTVGVEESPSVVIDLSHGKVQHQDGFADMASSLDLMARRNCGNVTTFNNREKVFF